MSLAAGTLVYGYPNPNKTTRPCFIGIVLRKSKIGDDSIDRYNIQYCYQIYKINTSEIKTYHMINFSVYESKQNEYKNK